MTVRTLLLRMCALGLLLLLNAMLPQAGIVALASCLAHLPGRRTLEADFTIPSRPAGDPFMARD